MELKSENIKFKILVELKVRPVGVQFSPQCISDLPLLPGQLLEKSSEKSDENKKDSISNYTEMMDYFSSSVGRCLYEILQTEIDCS